MRALGLQGFRGLGGLRGPSLSLIGVLLGASFAALPSGWVIELLGCHGCFRSFTRLNNGSFLNGQPGSKSRLLIKALTIIQGY